MTIALAGPYATQLLAALGATVIKVENPAGGDPSRNNAPYVGAGGLQLARARTRATCSISMLERGRNKLSVTLDLKRPEAREVFDDLARAADVVAENFSPGTADRLGVGYARLSGLNPRLVYLSISGFGSGEPGTGRDSMCLALSGLMPPPGRRGDPPVRNAVPFGDLVGPLFGVIGTVSALFMRASGLARGLVASAAAATAAAQQLRARARWWSANAASTWRSSERLTSAGRHRAMGHAGACRDRDAHRERRPRLAPFGIFATSDGYVALCAPTDAFALGVFEAIGEGGARRRRPVLDARPACRQLGRVARPHRRMGRRLRTPPRRRWPRSMPRGVPAATVRDTATAVRTLARFAAARPSSSSIRSSGRSRSSTGAAFPSASPAPARDTTHRRRGSASTTTSCSAGSWAIRPSGSTRFVPPALSEAPPRRLKARSQRDPGNGRTGFDPKGAASPDEYQVT